MAVPFRSVLLVCAIARLSAAADGDGLLVIPATPTAGHPTLVLIDHRAQHLVPTLQPPAAATGVILIAPVCAGPQDLAQAGQRLDRLLAAVKQKGLAPQRTAIFGFSSCGPLACGFLDQRHQRIKLLILAGTSPMQSQERLDDVSALLVYGARDPMVPENMRPVAEEVLRQRGCGVETLVIPEAEHMDLIGAQAGRWLRWLAGTMPSATPAKSDNVDPTTTYPWVTDLGDGGPRCPPLVSGERIVQVTRGGQVLLIEAGTGKVQARLPGMDRALPKDRRPQPATLAGDLLLLPGYSPACAGSESDRLLAIELPSGRRRWQVDNRGGIFSGITTDGALAGFGSHDTRWHLIDCAAGRELATLDTQGASCASRGLFLKDRFVVAGTATILAFDRVKRSPLWSRPCASYGRDPLAVTPDGTLILAADDKALLGLDPASGREHWRLAINELPACPPIIAGTNAVLATTATLVACDLRGAKRWTKALPGPLRAPLAAASGVVAVLDAQGCGRLLDAATGVERAVARGLDPAFPLVPLGKRWLGIRADGALVVWGPRG